MVFHGGDGSFELYEDDCSETVGMEPVVTSFTYTMGETVTFTMKRAEDVHGVIPADRSYTIRIRGIEKVEAENILLEKVESQGKTDVKTSYDDELKELVIKVNGSYITQFNVVIKRVGRLTALLSKNDKIRSFLQRAQIEYDVKEQVYNIVKNETNIVRIVTQLHELNIKNELFGAILERLSSDI